MQKIYLSKKMLVDTAYVSKTLQMDLFEQYKVTLKVPFRSNQTDYKKHPKDTNRKDKW